MAQTVQIVPQYSFPYVQTYINDYTIQQDDDTGTVMNPVVTYLYAFTSRKGINNTFVKREGLADFKATFGESNYSKYGQPLMTPLALFDENGISQGKVNVWCMRVMPENATYANTLIRIGFKADSLSRIISDETNETTETSEDGLVVTSTSVRTLNIETEEENATDGTTSFVAHEYVETTVTVTTYADGTNITTDEDSANDILVSGTDTTDGTPVVESVTTTVSYTKDGGEEISGSIPAFVTKASEKRFRVKFTASSGSVKSKDELEQQLDGGRTDDDGYETYPLMYFIMSGTGKYGNDYAVRITQSPSYDKDYNMKVLCFDIINTNGGVATEATYMGSLVDTTRYSEIIQISDIIDSAATGIAPTYIKIDQDVLELVYNAYVDFCTSQYDSIVEEYNTAYDNYIEEFGGTEDTDTEDTLTLKKLLSGMYTFNSITYAKFAEAYETLTNLQSLIDQTDPDTIIELDQFDPITGTRLGVAESLPLFAHTTYYDGDLNDPDNGLSEYDKLSYTSTETVDFTNVLGVPFSGGSDGYFDNPEERSEGWTYDDELEFCYNCAFNGTFDKRVLTSKRIFVDAFFDANYPVSVKHTLADLAIARNDAICYLDTGVIESFSKYQLQQLINEYQEYDSTYTISKNLHHYYVRESNTNKKVLVTSTYFLAQQYAYHMLRIGSHIPMVKKYAQLSGHVKDSLAPTIEDYEKDLKETLNSNRFNYFEVVSDNQFQRATQNTSQSINSDLLEESNVTTLFELKRGIEKDCEDHIYDFLDEQVRKDFREYELAKYNDWVGRKLYSFDIRFECNEYEYNRSILHCYVDIIFRPLIKQVTVEIDVNRRVYTESESE